MRRENLNSLKSPNIKFNALFGEEAGTQRKNERKMYRMQADHFSSILKRQLFAENITTSNMRKKPK
jgi:hypothetical protein